MPRASLGPCEPTFCPATERGPDTPMSEAPIEGVTLVGDEESRDGVVLGPVPLPCPLMSRFCPPSMRKSLPPPPLPVIALMPLLAPPTIPATWPAATFTIAGAKPKPAVAPIAAPLAKLADGPDPTGLVTTPPGPIKLPPGPPGPIPPIAYPPSVLKPIPASAKVETKLSCKLPCPNMLGIL